MESWTNAVLAKLKWRIVCVEWTWTRLLILFSTCCLTRSQHVTSDLIFNRIHLYCEDNVLSRSLRFFRSANWNYFPSIKFNVSAGRVCDYVSDVSLCQCLTIIFPLASHLSFTQNMWICISMSTIISNSLLGDSIVVDDNRCPKSVCEYNVRATAMPSPPLATHNNELKLISHREKRWRHAFWKASINMKIVLEFLSTLTSIDVWNR